MARWENTPEQLLHCLISRDWAIRVFSILLGNSQLLDRVLVPLTEVSRLWEAWSPLPQFLLLISGLAVCPPLIAMILFLSVCNEENPCEGMSRHATFENFGMAFLTLFQVSTGDNWNGIMKVTGPQGCGCPYCGEEEILMCTLFSSAWVRKWKEQRSWVAR